MYVFVEVCGELWSLIFGVLRFGDFGFAEAEGEGVDGLFEAEELVKVATPVGCSQDETTTGG